MSPERRPLADVVACIREGVTLEAAGRLTQANAERHLKDADEMARLFAEAPEAVEAERPLPRRARLQPRRTRPCPIPRNCARAMRAPQAALEAFTHDRRPRALSRRRSRKRERGAGARTHPDCSARTTPPISSPCTTSCASRARAASCARGAARRPIRRSASASGSPRSIPRASISCSSASSRPSATSRPTSTSISSTSGATR